MLPQQSAYIVLHLLLAPDVLSSWSESIPPSSNDLYIVVRKKPGWWRFRTLYIVDPREIFNKGIKKLILKPRESKRAIFEPYARCYAMVEIRFYSSWRMPPRRAIIVMDNKETTMMTMMMIIKWLMKEDMVTRKHGVNTQQRL
jgi:hypothetical protein